MKKILLSIILLLLMTGCTATYEIKVSNEKIYENLTVLESRGKSKEKVDELGNTFETYAKKYGTKNKIITSFYYLYSDQGCVENCSYYNNKYINNEENIGYLLSNTFSFEEYKDSAIANELLPGFSSEYDGRYLTISGGNSWNFINGYNNLDKITINIETNYKITSTNGKKINNTTYQWNVYKGNTDGLKGVYIVIDTKEIIKEKKSSLISYIIIVIVLIVLIFVGIFLSNKNKQENSI